MKIILTLILAIALIGCEKENTKEMTTEEILVRQWQKADAERTIATYNQNGSLILTRGTGTPDEETINYTWRLNSDKTILYWYYQGQEMRLEILEISEEKMRLKYYYNNGEPDEMNWLAIQ